MKRIMLICMMVLMCVLPAFGALDKCIPRPSSTSGTKCTLGSAVAYMWEANCPSFGRVVGMWTCSDTVPSSSTVGFKPGKVNASVGRWCYCRMIEPGLSEWWLGLVALNDQLCVNACAAVCADTFISSSVVNSTIRF